MADVTVYGSPVSTYVRSVRMTLAEKDVPYELVEGWADHPEIAKRQPFGKVPAFRHGDLELYESFAIARYVDEAFRGPALQPGDAKARARMTQLISMHSGYCYPTMIGGIGVVAMKADSDRSPRSVSCIETAGSSGSKFRLRAREIR